MSTGGSSLQTGAPGAEPKAAPGLVAERGVAEFTFITLEKQVSVLGRSAEADIVIQNANISRKHAQFTVQGGGCQIRDLGSTNGTFHNGSRLGPDAVPLLDGDLLELARGEVALRFQDAVVAEAPSSADAPELPSQISPEGTVTILFTDIVGSTAMAERLGDQKWQEVLTTHNQILRDQVERNQGFEVKSQGDGFMIAFSSARRAILCAIDIQKAFAIYSMLSPDEAIGMRIGLHTGEVIKEGEDFFGKNVNLAARISAQAGEGEILASSLLKELTESSVDLTFDEARELELKGLSGTYHVYPVVWEEEEELPSQTVTISPSA